MYCKFQRFFGIIRSSAGCSNQPDAVTFLQLYKLLSFFGVVKPPKKGNCTIDKSEDNKRLVGVADLKSIFSKTEKNNPTKKQISELKNKLDIAIDTGAWEDTEKCETDEFQQYASSLPQCLIYYLTGILEQK